MFWGTTETQKTGPDGNWADVDQRGLRKMALPIVGKRLRKQLAFVAVLSCDFRIGAVNYMVHSKHSQFWTVGIPYCELLRRTTKLGKGYYEALVYEAQVYPCLLYTSPSPRD